jgi:hypothetical protein
MSRNLGALTLLDPSGPAWPVMGVLYFLLNGKNIASLRLLFTDMTTVLGSYEYTVREKF